MDVCALPDVLDFELITRRHVLCRGRGGGCGGDGPRSRTATRWGAVEAAVVGPDVVLVEDHLILELAAEGVISCVFLPPGLFGVVGERVEVGSADDGGHTCGVGLAWLWGAGPGEEGVIVGCGFFFLVVWCLNCGVVDDVWGTLCHVGGGGVWCGGMSHGMG